MKRIAFKPELARAIRDGRKTETRRLMSPQPSRDWSSPPARFAEGKFNRYGCSPGEDSIRAAYQVGEVIGVTEPWFVPAEWAHLSGSEIVKADRTGGNVMGKAFIHYLADGAKPKGYGRFRQARFLPDAFVRTTIRITEVRAERLQEITEKAILAEGCTVDVASKFSGIPWSYLPTLQHGWIAVWDSIHGQDTKKPGGEIVKAQPWSADPWVFVYRFEVESL